MKEYRGVIVQMTVLLCLTALAIKSTDQYVVHTVIGVLGASAGHSMSRARQGVASEPGKPSPTSGFTVPPLMGGIVGAALAICSLMFVSACVGQSTVAQYEAEQIQCVAVAKTRLEADECRALARAKYFDGGPDGSR